MSKDQSSSSEAKRLESLWSGDFGNEYIERNRQAGGSRQQFWEKIIGTYDPERVLEIGCNVGANLQWIAQSIAPRDVYGIDINEKALKDIHAIVPGINTTCCPARELPFRDRWFDLVFTMGVLIHQPDATLPLVMAEIVRCSRKFVLCGEYFAKTTEHVPYRGETGALFRRDYGSIYLQLFPELTLRDHGFLGKDQGWDDISWWLFEKSG
jgi:pseudaminic acid biosynthesis-associated methylase